MDQSQTGSPSFAITGDVVRIMGEVGGAYELLGAVKGAQARAGRWIERASRASLAMEDLAYTKPGVFAVSDGAPGGVGGYQRREIESVRRMYEQGLALDPLKAANLAVAHKTLMSDLARTAGVYRSAQAQESAEKLVSLASNPILHPLLSACSFLVSFQRLRPFGEGDGYIARLWFSVLVRRINPDGGTVVLEEALLGERERYQSLLSAQGDSTELICLLLGAVRDAVSAAAREEISASKGKTVQVGTEPYKSEAQNSPKSSPGEAAEGSEAPEKADSGRFQAVSRDQPAFTPVRGKPADQVPTKSVEPMRPSPTKTADQVAKRPIKYTDQVPKTPTKSADGTDQVRPRETAQRAQGAPLGPPQPDANPRQNSRAVSSADLDRSTEHVARLLTALGSETLSAKELMSRLSLKHTPTFRSNYLAPALTLQLIEMTVPDRPNSSLQRYRAKHARG